ncbi:MAG: sensor histidine kinase [Pirellulales bacterium]
MPLAVWLRELTDAWHARPHGEHVRLDVQADAVVRASPALLRQLLDNLINNALKYGRLDKPVTVTLERQGASIAISVADEGPGVAPADQSSLFQPFFRTASARRSGVAGTGLGLAVAARIAAGFGRGAALHGPRRRRSSFHADVARLRGRSQRAGRRR